MPNKLTRKRSDYLNMHLYVSRPGAYRRYGRNRCLQCCTYTSDCPDLCRTRLGRAVVSSNTVLMTAWITLVSLSSAGNQIFNVRCAPYFHQERVSNNRIQALISWKSINFTLNRHNNIKFIIWDLVANLSCCRAPLTSVFTSLQLCYCFLQWF